MVADAQVSPLAAGSTSGPAKASKAQISDTTSVETQSVPAADPQAENSKTQDKKVSGSKDNSSKTQASTVKDSSTVSLKPAQPQPSGDERAAARQGTAENSGTPAPHQAHEQASEHAAASTRAASAVAHNDLPAFLTQPLTAQSTPNPSALGLTVAAPLASPVQTIFQPAPDRPDSSDKAVPISGVAVEIVSRAEDGLRRFEIRLDPPELGRIDVRLDVDNGGNVRSRLTVDRPETLDLLRRDAPQLERALQHAGLNTEGGLQFSLRDQNFANRDQSPRNTPTFIVPDDEAAAADAARRGYGRLVGLGSGVDIRV
jgi:chemotaxis protein MotD